MRAIATRWSIFPEIKGRFPAELFVGIYGTFGDAQGAYRTKIRCKSHGNVDYLATALVSHFITEVFFDHPILSIRQGRDQQYFGESTHGLAFLISKIACPGSMHDRAPQPVVVSLFFRPGRHESPVNRKQASQKKEKTGSMTILYTQK